MELKNLTLSQPSGVSVKKSCLRRFFSRNSKVEPINPKQREQIAKTRWEKVAKLRSIIQSISETRNQATYQDSASYVETDPNENPMILQNTRKKYIIYPWQTWKLNFDILVAMLIIYYCVTVPFRISFLGPDNSSEIYTHEVILELVMLADVVIRFFTAYVDNFEIVDDLRSIAKNYLTGMFVFDVLAVLPFYLITHELLWIKIGRMFRVDNIFDSIQNASFKNRSVGTAHMHMMRLTKLLIYLGVVCHLMACIWNYIVDIQPEHEDESWKMGLNMNSGESYMTSLYHILVTFATVGYGDVGAKTNSEIAFVILIEFIGILFFANLNSNITNIFTQMKSKENAKSAEIRNLDIWLLKLDRSRPDKRMQGNLLTYVRDFYTYVWDNDYSSLANSDYMYRLSPAIQANLIKKLFKDETDMFHIFFKGCPESFKYEVVMNIYPRKFNENEEIIPEGSDVDYIYFIWSGDVMVGTRLGTQIYLKLPNGSFFGDEFVLFKSKASHAFLAGKYGCELYCINKQKFNQILGKFPAAFKELTQRAFKRGLYFRAVRCTSIASTTGHSLQKSGIDLLVNTEAQAKQILQEKDDLNKELTPEQWNHLKHILESPKLEQSNFHQTSLKNLTFAADKLKEVNIETESLASQVKNLQSTMFEDMEMILNGIDSISSLADMKNFISSLKIR